LAFAEDSDQSRASVALAFEGAPRDVLLPCWRFLREFQSCGYSEPHWPVIAGGRLVEIRQRIDQARCA
jgi:hypothetical protein